MSLAISINEDLAQLLHRLAEENDETPEELIGRLIQKEHFERHTAWDALRGTSKPKACMSRKCFMAGSSPSIHGDMLMPESRNTAGEGEG